MRTQFVGILNITPDSFSDGGCYNTTNAALSHAKQLIAEGVDVIDVGAESTRPGATPLTSDEEWQRLNTTLPSIVQTCHQHNVSVSLDTYHADTAKRAIACGVDWINDVSAATQPALLEAVANAPHVKYVLMHSLTVPARRDVTLSASCDPIHEVNHFFKDTSNTLRDMGIADERIIYDPGIGFGKTASQSLALLWRIQELTIPKEQLYIGHSRKSCFALISEDKRYRDILTLTASSFLMQHKIGYIRVHNVRDHATIQKTLTIS